MNRTERAEVMRAIYAPRAVVNRLAWLSQPAEDQDSMELEVKVWLGELAVLGF